MPKPDLRFSLRGMLAFVFLICAALAAVYYGGPRVAYIIAAVAIAVFVALFVTFGLRFPRNGGYRNEFKQDKKISKPID